MANHEERVLCKKSLSDGEKMSNEKMRNCMTDSKMSINTHLSFSTNSSIIQEARQEDALYSYTL